MGAYYYVWYDAAEWRKGYLGDKLAPPIRPFLGEYSSADPRVAAQHVAWASEYGIDFFAVSWAGRGSPADRYLEAGLLAAPNVGDIRFAILYESLLALGHRDHRVDFDDATTGRFVSDLDYLARRYLSHPRYLTLDGRPVLFLYVTRSWRSRGGWSPELAEPGDPQRRPPPAWRSGRSRAGASPRRPGPTPRAGFASAGARSRRASTSWPGRTASGAG